MSVRRPIAVVLVLASMFLVATVQAATITVNSLDDTAADDGVCTLREAIKAANLDSASGVKTDECAAGSGSDLIEFSVAGVIQPATALPSITTVIHMDGYSAPGASKNTHTMSQGSNATLTIEIDGKFIVTRGLVLSGSGASGSTIEGLVFSNTGAVTCCQQIAIAIQSVDGAATTTIRGNFLGTNAAGTQRSPRGSVMLYIEYSANIVIGSDVGGSVLPEAVNVISGGESIGLSIYQVTNFRLRGNYIGTNAAGTAELHHANQAVQLDGATSAWLADNVISGNGAYGINFRPPSSDVHIERNLIGTNAAGTAPLPNGSSGIYIVDNPNSSPYDITNVDVVDNLVAYNLCTNCSGGIVIGIENSANSAVGIRLSRNRVFSNQGLEIDLAAPNPTPFGLIYGVTPNDSGDPDSGPNNFQNFPVLSSAAGDGTDVLVSYSLNSEVSRNYTLQFFHTTTCDASGYGGAETYLGEVTDLANGSGNLSGQKLLTGAPQAGFITATATNSTNGTSEFSACVGIITPSNIVFADGFEQPPP